MFDATSPSSPAPTPDQMTMTHLLSLPPLLSPISRPLAALHLARVRLLLSIPTAETSGNIGEWWCHSCGGLREGMGGGRRRKRKILDSNGDGGRVEDTVGGRMRKAALCGVCGTKFGRPKVDRNTLITYPSARIAARQRRAAAATTAGDTTSAGAGPSNSPTRLNGRSDGSPLLNEDSLPGAVQSTISTNTPLPSLLHPSQPSFSRVRDTPPNTPTYPPPPSRSTSPDSSAGPPKKGIKRKKKSGLAKLLAENKERTAQASMGGSWGLG